MAASESPAVLCLSPGGLLDVDPTNLDAVHNLWAAFSRAKNCIADGERLEYLSWRLYSREMVARYRNGNSSKVNPFVPTPVPELAASGADSDANASDGENSVGMLNHIFDSESTSGPTSGPDTLQHLQNLRESRNWQPAAEAVPGAVTSTRLLPPDAIMAKNGVCTNHYRRISSNELQDLFEHPVTIQKLSSQCLSGNSISNCSPQKEDLHLLDHRESFLQHNPPLSQSMLAVNAYTNQYGNQYGNQTSQTASDQSINTRGRTSQQHDSFTSIKAADPSKAIRGFSPSNVSVSVNRNHSSIIAQAGHSSRTTRSSDISRSSASSTNGERTDTSNKMFFIQGDSDSDSGGDVDEGTEFPIKDGEIHEAGPASITTAKSPAGPVAAMDWTSDRSRKPNVASHTVAETAINYHSKESADDPEEFSDSGHATNENTNDDEDGWDDTDDNSCDDEEDEQAYKAAEEERRRKLFSERAVPLQPLLKPSLLSSLFLHKADNKPLHPRPQSNINPEDTKSGPSSSSTSKNHPHKVRTSAPAKSSNLANELKSVSGDPGSNGRKSPDGVPAPVDILLGAPLAIHTPFTVASPRTVRRDMMCSELSQSLRDNIQQSRAFDVDIMFKNNLMPAGDRGRDGYRSRRTSGTFSAPTRSSSLSRPSSRSRTRNSNSNSIVNMALESQATSPVFGGHSITAPAMDYWPAANNNHSSQRNVQSIMNSIDRPDMKRRTTDPVSQHLQHSSQSWSNRDEDIYDPLNYHSRGW